MTSYLKCARRLLPRIAMALLLFVQSSTASPPVDVVGTNRLAWNQPSPDASQPRPLSYAIYIDGVRSHLDGVSCDASATGGGTASCSVALPTLSPGQHAIKLATYVPLNGGVVESIRSSELVVNMVSDETAKSRLGATDSGSSSAVPALSGLVGAVAVAPGDLLVTTTDQVQLRVGLLLEGVNNPNDVGIADDGRLFIAEQSGRVRIGRDGQLSGQPALTLDDVTSTGSGSGGLVALALDPQFGSTHFVYLAYTSATKSGGTAFRLSRFREVNDTLGERVILLDGVETSASQPAASLRFGPDGKLYAAFDDGGDPRLGGDMASYNAKILRLDPDGTTPADQAGYTPVYASGFSSPKGLDWQPGNAALWVANSEPNDMTRLAAIQAEIGQPIRATTTASYSLSSFNASGLAFYNRTLIPAFRGNLLVAESGGDLLRVRFDDQSPTRMLAMERLLHGRLGTVRFVSVPADGSVYLGTSTSVMRMVPIG